MDWLVNTKGECAQISSPSLSADGSYRLYRFLTDLEDILNTTNDDRLIIQAICPLVRRLLISSPWIQLSGLEPDPDLGWAVQTLYDEPDFPLTVQLVSWLPHQVSPIHNHGAWGVVAIINGVEKNYFWQRVGDRKSPDKIKPVGDRLLLPGEIIGFTSEAIHSIEAIDTTISFNVYGETKYDQRFEFYLADSTAQLF
jgi:predicted metal-dependent enzyme (double-stranded beta helix superfamily)